MAAKRFSKGSATNIRIVHIPLFILYPISIYIYIHNDISRAFQGSLGVFGKHKTHMTHVPRASSAPTCQVDVPQRPRTLPGGLSPLLQWAQRTSNKSGKHDKIQQKRRDETAVLLSLEADCLRLHMIAVQFRQHFCNANPEIDSKPVPVDMSKARQCCHVMCVLQGFQLGVACSSQGIGQRSQELLRFRNMKLSTKHAVETYRKWNKWNKRKN